MPSYRRNDADKWARWKFYPGAMTLCIPRFLAGCVIGILLNIILKVMLIGQEMNEPIRGCRRKVIRGCYRAAAFSFNLFVNFVWMSSKKLTLEDVNYYQEWLGPIDEQQREHSSAPENYAAAINEADQHTVNLNAVQHRNMGSTDVSDNNAFVQSPTSNSGNLGAMIPKRGPGPTSTIICNHVGWIDIISLIQSSLHPGFTPKDELSDVPLLGLCMRGLQSLFVFRGNDAEAKNRVVE